MNADEAGIELSTPNEVTDVPGAPSVFSVGSQLQAVREEKGLTVAEVSRSLKLSMRQVQAIESDDWSSLPTSAIVRGFIRNYARLLGMDYAVLIPALDRLQKKDEPELKVHSGPQVDLPRQGRLSWRDMSRVVAGLVIFLLALSIYFVLPDNWRQRAINTINSVVGTDQSSRPVQESVEDEHSGQVGQESTQAAAVVPQTGGENIPEPQSASENSGVTGLVEPAPAATPPVSEPTTAPITSSRLSISSQKDAWIEVRDGTGDIIFSQVNRAGEKHELTGKPPFLLVVGNASHVTVYYKGKPVDLSDRSKGDVARVTLK